MALVINKLHKLDREFEAIAWAIKVRSKDEMRKNLQMILIDNGQVLATDGHRLHLSKVERAIDNGLYNVVLANAKTIVLEKDTEGYEYPDYKRVIPDADTMPEATATVHRNNGDKTQLLRAVYQMCSVKLDYLLDAYMPETTCTVRHYGGSKALTITEDRTGENEGDPRIIDRLALIMPLKES